MKKKIKIPYERLEKYFRLYDAIEDWRYKQIDDVEKQMQMEFDEPLLGFHESAYGHGIGTPSKPEKMDLVMPKTPGIDDEETKK